MYRQTDIQTVRQTEVQTDIQTERQVGRQTDIRTDDQTDEQKEKQNPNLHNTLRTCEAKRKVHFIVELCNLNFTQQIILNQYH